jgi:hypothetical protein
VIDDTRWIGKRCGACGRYCPLDVDQKFGNCWQPLLRDHETGRIWAYRTTVVEDSDPACRRFFQTTVQTTLAEAIA